MKQQKYFDQVQRQQKRPPFKMRPFFAYLLLSCLLCITAVGILSYGNVIFSQWAQIFSIIMVPLGIMVAICQWLFPVPPNEPPASHTPTAKDQSFSINHTDPTLITQVIIPPASSAWNIPYRRNPFFTGREELIRKLREQLTTKNASALTQAQAISGLGGIGKTQIAVEYAYRYRTEYQYVLWASAADAAILLSSIVEIAHTLQLPERYEQDQTIIAKP